MGILALSRQMTERSAECNRGDWKKVSKGCFEVRGKTLGIIGYGHVGSQVSVLAESLGLKVVFYDVIPKMAMGNARSCQSLDELLGQSDFVTLHVPQLASTVDLIGAKEIAMMPKGSFLINLSRGNVGDADVFPKEPKGNGEGNFESPLCGLKNMILTPH